MKQLGVQFIVDAWQSPRQLLDNPEFIRQALTGAAGAGGAHLLEICVHQLYPQGVTATAILTESHIALHTWPEYEYFAADLFFCGQGNGYRAMRFLQEKLRAGQMKFTEIRRGFEQKTGSSSPAMELSAHGGGR